MKKGHQVTKSPSRRRLKDFFVCLLSAGLLILSFPRFDLSFVAWFAFLPFFFSIKGRTWLQGFKLGFLVGVFFFVGTIYWLVNVILPGVNPIIGYLGIIFLIFYLALYFGIFGVVFSLYNSKMFFTSILFFPAAWVILEYIRMHMFTGFGWVSLGYSQYLYLPIIQIADIASVYGISFIVMAANISIFKIISLYKNKENHYKKEIGKIILAFGIILVAVYFYGLYRLNVRSDQEKIRVSLVQANIPLKDTWDKSRYDGILKRHFELTRKALKDSPDLIIWPESAISYHLDRSLAYQEELKGLLSFINGNKITLLSGIISFEQGIQNTEGKIREDKYYNSAVLFSKNASVLASYDKIHLVPFGEYMPLRDRIPILAEFVPMDDFNQGQEFTIFSCPLREEKKSIFFATLICFEDIFPELAREFTKRGANILINITNDAWFKDTSSPYQHMQQAVFRAIENRRPLVRAANTGISCFIDLNGKICSYVENEKGKKTFIDGYKVNDIFYNKSGEETIYTKYGDFFIGICIIIVLFCAIKVFYKKR